MNFGGGMFKKQAPPAAAAASGGTRNKFGVEKLAPGTRVSHTIFGTGTIVSAKDIGGDVLYEISFDSGATKKLMATYAKLVKI
jgi:hypothetical protein